MLDLGLRVLGPEDGDDIEAEVVVAQTVAFDDGTGGTVKTLLLDAVDRAVDVRVCAGAAGSHLDKSHGLATDGDEVQLAMAIADVMP